MDRDREQVKAMNQRAYWNFLGQGLEDPPGYLIDVLALDYSLVPKNYNAFGPDNKVCLHGR